MGQCGETWKAGRDRAMINDAKPIELNEAEGQRKGVEGVGVVCCGLSEGKGVQEEQAKQRGKQLSKQASNQVSNQVSKQTIEQIGMQA